jgi:hypothetical protein
LSIGEGDVRSLSKKLIAGIIGINLIGLMLTAVWFRCYRLENIPGLNGDEAWYGVQAVEMLRGGEVSWQTPTGNPLNPLFIGPLILLHCLFQPSIVLLRSLAVAGGLAALLINWIMCSWVYDRRTAWLSTAVLAVLPIDIAYSRFAWDASQSLVATLPVIYFALAAVRFPGLSGRMIALAVACQVLAVLVHPTNIFTVAMIVAAVAVKCDPSQIGSSIGRVVRQPIVIVSVLIVGLLIGFWIIWLMHTPMPHWLDARLRASMNPNATPDMPILFSRLFVGGTIYRYLAGSHSWFEWPLAFDREGFGADVIVFWLLNLAAVIIVWRSWKRSDCREDGALIAGWMLEVSAFFVLAGPGALAPGQERFAFCLVAPTIILLCRAWSLLFAQGSSASRMALMAAIVAGWFVLADYHVHYFRFIEQTGGQAHLTFRTGAEEPKLAALKYIVKNRRAGETLIVASEWWNRWPLRYLGMAEKDLRVITPREAAVEIKSDPAVKTRVQLWYVEFSGSRALRKVERESAAKETDRHEIRDFGGRPILTVLEIGD